MDPDAMTRPRIAVLIDLPRGAAAGGHVKYWERVAQAAAYGDAPVDLTLYFSGTGDDEVLSPFVRYRYLSPVFSTAKLKFLPYVPAHTDLAGFHPALAQQLPNYDLIHTTDAYFAFARTAERIARWHNIPLTTSFHTDTPAYAELFTRQTLRHIFGDKCGGWLADTFDIPARERAKKEKRLRAHLAQCAAIFAMRTQDRALTPADKIKPMRLGVDKNMFTTDCADCAGIERDYKIPAGRFIILFVGRVDAGKNAPLLLQACATAIQNGVDLHLIVAGLGPVADDMKKTLGERVTLAGLVEPAALARLYASVDCLAMISDIEIGGMIGLEALACGCPVLVSRHSQVAAACDAAAVMQEIDSTAQAWAQAFQQCARDPTLQQRRRVAALTFRRDRLAGWDDVLTQDFLPVWQDTVRKGHL